MCAVFNGQPGIKNVSYYNPSNASDERDIHIFYNELSSLVLHIPKYNVLITSGDVGDPKFCLHNTPNKNGKYLAEFSRDNKRACLNTKFRKKERKIIYLIK